MIDYVDKFFKNQQQQQQKAPGTHIMSEYSKVTGHQDNIQKSVAFLYSSNEQLEFEI